MATVDPGMLTDWYKSYMDSQPKAAGYDAAQAQASTVNPGRESTVQGQLTNVLDKGGPLADRATTKSMQAMNGKGLLNSSLAVSAGQTALYDAALPIAQQDAKTWADAGQTNAQLGTQVSLSNAGFKNDAGKFGADAANQALSQQRAAGVQSEQAAQQRAEAALGRDFTTSERLGTQGFQASESAADRQQQSMLQTTDIAAQAQRQITEIQAQAEQQGRQLTAQEQAQIRDLSSQQAMQQAGFQQQTALQTQDLARQAEAQKADLASRYDLAQLDVASRERLQAADALNQQKLQQANAALQTGLQATDNAVKQSMQAYDGALKQAMQGLDNESKLQLATLDADNRVALATMEAKYKNELQANQSMAASYQSMVDSFTRVMVSPDLDAPAKQAVIGNMTTLYNNTLQMQSDVSGLELGTLLAPEALGGTPAPTPGAAPAPAPTPAPAPPPFYYENPGGA